MSIDLIIHLKLYKIKSFILIVLLLFVYTPQQQVYGQSIKLSALNNGGKTSNTNSMHLEWSMGESITVGASTSGSALFTFGVLQPAGQVITGISELGSTVFGNTIQVLPNPTTGPLEILTNLSQVGKLTFRVLNSKSEIRIQQVYSVFPNKQIQAISLNEYPPGIYYVHILFESQKGFSKTGIFKIIKL